MASGAPLADVLVCPPATPIAAVVKTASARIANGEQDCSTEVAILALPDVGGALVGGASLEAAAFEAIVKCIPA